MPYKDKRKRAEAVYKWRKKNPESYRKLARDSAKRQYGKKKDLLVAAKSIPCADCKQVYPPYVMDFDHRDPALKRIEVSKMLMAGYSVQSLLDEIAKCDVVCANCHRERTYGLGVMST